MEGLRVFPERMRRNLEQEPGLYHSGALLLALARAGISREDAYSLVQENALKAWESESDFETLVRADERIPRYLDEDSLDSVFDPERHLAQVDLLFQRVLAQE